jgi:hypothetical protein
MVFRADSIISNLILVYLNQLSFRIINQDEFLLWDF